MIRTHLFLLLTLILAVDEAYSLPLFARKYNTTCFTCHIAPPLLNDFGERFRSNGFEIPGARTERTTLEDNGILPLALITQPMVAHEQQKDNLYSRVQRTTLVKGLGVELFSIAPLGKHFSYFSEIEVALNGEESEVELNMLYAQYTDVLNTGSGALNFRLGKMHFLQPLTHTSFLANTDPLIYGDHPFPATTTTLNDLHFAHSMFSVAAYGILPGIHEGLQWELGYTTGAKNTVDLRNARGLFGSVNQGFAIDQFHLEAGAFFFGAKQRITIDGYSRYPKTNNHYRTGVALKLFDPWINRFHLYGQYVLGRDDNIDYWGEDRKVTGSFAGVDAIVLPEKLYAFARYDLLDAGDTLKESATQIDCGLRYHLLSNLVLTGGVTIHSLKSGKGSASTSGGHSHSIIPAGPLDADDEPSGPSPATVSASGPVDLTTTTFKIGLMIGY